MVLKRLLLALALLSTTGCACHTVSGLICRSNFEMGQQCTVYDPILKQQVPIDPDGVVVTCDKAKTCFYTYTDSMGNTWNGKLFTEI